MSCGIPDICMIAPPGAGKGTQADELVRTTGRIHVEISAALGALPPDLITEKAIKGGGLASDNRAFWALSRHLRTLGPDTSLIVDGLPRTYVQARATLQYFQRRTGVLPLILILDVPDSICLKRLAHRARQAQMAREMRDARDGHRTLPERQDDTPEVHAVRLRGYNERLVGILDYMTMNANDQLIRIDGSGTIEEVSDQIHRRVSPRIATFA